MLRQSNRDAEREKDSRKVSSIYKRHIDLQDSTIGERYAEFHGHAKNIGICDTEFLLPTRRYPFKTSLLDEQSASLSVNDAMNYLQKRNPVDGIYYAPLCASISTLGHDAELHPKYMINKYRSQYRMSKIWQSINEFLEGVDRSSIMDIGCNIGHFSAEACLQGFRNVVGVDARQENIDRANALLEHYGLHGFEFQCKSWEDIESQKTYEVVLNLGLLYHVTNPFSLLSKTHKLTRKIAVIDTLCHKEAFSGFLIGSGKNAPDLAATTESLEFHPTYRGLIDMLYAVGFKDLIEIIGCPPEEWQDFSLDAFGMGYRRCILAFK